MLKRILILSLVLLPATTLADAVVRAGSVSYKLRQGTQELGTFTGTTAHVDCKAAARARTTSPLATAIEVYQLRTGSGQVLETLTTYDQCAGPDPGNRVIQRLLEDGRTRTEGGNVNSCVNTTRYSTAFQPPSCVATFNYIASYFPSAPVEPPPVTNCPTAPLPRQISRACPSGTTGTNWTQIISVTVGAAPTCALAIVIAPAAAPAEECAPVTSAPGQAHLSWIASVSNVSGYLISYGATPTELVRTVLVPSPSITQYTVTGLAPGAHYFGVRAYTDNIGAESVLSNIVRKEVQ